MKKEKLSWEEIFTHKFGISNINKFEYVNLLDEDDVMEIVKRAIEEEREKIFKVLKCPECNECEDFEEGYNMLVNHIEKVREELNGAKDRLQQINEKIEWLREQEKKLSVKTIKPKSIYKIKGVENE